MTIEEDLKQAADNASVRLDLPEVPTDVPWDEHVKHVQHVVTLIEATSADPDSLAREIALLDRLGDLVSPFVEKLYEESTVAGSYVDAQLEQEKIEGLKKLGELEDIQTSYDQQARMIDHARYAVAKEQVLESVRLYLRFGKRADE